MIPYTEKLRYSKFLQILLIILLCFIIYIPSLLNGFIWDDDQNLFKSPWIQGADGLRVIWFTNKTYQYYPVDFTTFWLEHKLWGLNPFGYHVVNLFLHILNALLVFWVVRKLYKRLAFSVALLFAVHPIQVETVAWITERKNLLSLFFFLLAILAYLRFDRIRRIRYYLLTVVMFVCALLSKSIAVCFIFFPVLYKWWKDARVTWREIRLSIVFVVIGLLSAFYTLYLEFYHVGAQGKVFDLTFLERFILSGRIIFFYVYKLLFPFNFMFFYPRWIIDTKIWWQWLFILAVVLILGTLVIYRKKIGRGALALFIFYIISIFPVLGFLNVYGMKFSFVADHFSYLSTPALLLLLCVSIRLFFDKLSIKFPLLMSTPYRIVMPILLAIITIYMGGKSMALTQSYKNAVVLWEDVIRKNPKAWIAYNNLGSAYNKVGKYEEAIPLLNKAIKLEPGYAEAYNNLGNAYNNIGNYEEAIALYKKAIELNPLFVEIYYNLGNAIRSIGNYEEAIALYKKAIELNPDYAGAFYNNLGLAYNDIGEKEKAIASYKKAIALDPNCAEPYNNLGNIYKSLGRTEEAIALYKKAIKVKADNAEIYYNLGSAYSDIGKNEEAIVFYKKAIVALNPNRAEAYYNLGNAYNNIGNYEEAIVSYKRAIALNPHFEKAYNNLAVIYYLQKQYDLAIKYYDRAIALGYENDPIFLKLLKPYRQAQSR